MPFIGFILIAMALFAVGGTLYMVVREKPGEHEEWYIPPQQSSAVPPVVTPPAQPGTTSVPTPAPSAPDTTSSEPDKTE